MIAHDTYRVGSCILPAMHRRSLLAIVLLVGCKPDRGSEVPAIDLVVAPATYGENAHPPDKECKFDSELTTEITRAIPGAKTGATSSNELSVVVTRVQGAEPGWQGDITVNAEAKLSGAEPRTARFRQSVAPGVLGGKKGVCDGLERVARVLAEDIAEWVTASSGEEGEGETPKRRKGPSEKHEARATSKPGGSSSNDARDIPIDDIVE